MSIIKEITIETPQGSFVSGDIGANAQNIDYNNTESGLTADNVQDAIDEIAQSGGGTSLKYTKDGANGSYNVISNATEDGTYVDPYDETDTSFTANVVDGLFSHAEGLETTANGFNSHAEGCWTEASGDYGAHAEGNQTIANGDNSHAEGYQTTANENNTHTEGNYTIASGVSSHAEGDCTTASGSVTHAEGYGTCAASFSSHAEGWYTRASGEVSHAEGRETIAGYNNQHVQGLYNDNKSTTLFEVGNGTATTARSNAFEVYNDGSLSTDNGTTKVKLENVALKSEIPAAQVNSDWNASSGKAEILNKPTLGTAAALNVATIGDASTTEVVKGDDSRLTDARNAADVSAWAKATTKPIYSASEVGAIATTAKGVANGVAELDSGGKVPASQLPSYVDDVVEYASTSQFPVTGESGKIYIALDTNKTYRWSGSAYVEISASLALGITSDTAYYGDKGKTAYDHSQITNGNPHNVTATDVGLGNVGNFKAVSTVASQGLTSTEQANARTNIGAGTGDGTITSVKMNGYTISSSGEADLGTVITSHQDISSKADKVTGATSGHFAGLDANGNLTDSGKGPSDLGGNGAFYGTCDTTASTAAKTVTCSDFTSADLVAGTVINVSFTYNNTATDPTMSVNGTTAKPIMRFGTTPMSSSYSWISGSLVPFVYDGTNWVMTTGAYRGASTSNYGLVMLSNSTTSDVTNMAATPSAVKTINDAKINNTVVAPVESGTTASQAYAIGAQFLKDGVLYKAKTAIASGDTLTLNTNYEAADNIVTQLASGGGGGGNDKMNIDGSNAADTVSFSGNLIQGFFTTTPLSNWKNISTLLYATNGSCATMYNNEIHVLGGSYTFKHCKWDGSTWSELSSLPYSCLNAQVVVYNNQIHLLGGSTYSTYHYRWNGSSWYSVSTLPYSFVYGSAVVYNNEIHILGGNNGPTKHYKWNGSSWTQVSTLPYSFYYGCAVIYNDEIHILGGSGTSARTYHYKWNGSSWYSVSTLPYNFTSGSAVVYNNEIHILGSFDNSLQHYKWNGSSWSFVSTLPIPSKGFPVIKSSDNQKIYLLAKDSDIGNPGHYEYNKDSFSNNYSYTGGYQTYAGGQGSHVEGYSTCNNYILALGDGAHAEGYTSTIPTMAIGAGSHAEGMGTTALANYTHAEGECSKASYRNAHAEGYHTSAVGNSSHTEGYCTRANSSYSHAEGDQTYAGGNRSHAEGYYTQASSNSSHAEGGLTTASADYSHAEGYKTSTISGEGAHAEGYSSCTGYIIASGKGSHAEGYTTSTSGKTIASGNGSHAEGISTTASGEAAHAEGYTTNAGGSYSHAEGYFTTAGYEAQHVSGKFNSNKSNTLLEIGNGTSNTHSNAFEVYSDGTLSTDNGTTKVALQNLALKSEVPDTSTFMTKANPTGTGSLSLNRASESAIGNYSVAEGYHTIASGQASHAEGRETCASGNYSHAEGYITTARGESSHAEGHGTYTSGNCSHAEGYHSQAANSYSHAAGYYGSAYGNTQFIENQSRRVDAHPIQFAFGTNIEASPTSSMFIDINDKNTFSIDQQGSIFARGAMGVARGYIHGVLVNGGPRIILEDGASYMLYVDARNTSTGAWRGAQAYYIAGGWNQAATGLTTTALAVPHAAALGAVGSCGVKLTMETEAYSDSGTTKYHGKLGIGSCGTAYGVRWNLVKVIGSESDFEY